VQAYAHATPDRAPTVKPDENSFQLRQHTQQSRGRSKSAHVQVVACLQLLPKAEMSACKKRHSCRLALPTL
jgi:hypothetical protein